MVFKTMLLFACLLSSFVLKYVLTLSFNVLEKSELLLFENFGFLIPEYFNFIAFSRLLRLTNVFIPCSLKTLGR